MSKTTKRVVAPSNDRTRQALLDVFERGRGYGFSYAEQLRHALDVGLHRFGLGTSPEVPEKLRETTRLFLETYASAVRELPPFEDILGPLYMDLASRGGKQILGQFFTPQTIADFMSRMLHGDASPAHSDQLVRVCDPASGSGVMMLSYCRAVLDEFGSEGLAHVSITCVDLDRYCALMSALQFLCNAMICGVSYGELIVVHGNSLFPDKLWDVVVHATHSRFSADSIPPATHEDLKQAVQRAAQVAHQQDLSFH